MQITFDIPTAFFNRAVTAICARTNYQDMVPDPNGIGPMPPQIPNPVTKAQWTKQQVSAWIREQVYLYESAEDDAVKRAEINSNVIT